MAMEPDRDEFTRKALQNLEALVVARTEQLRHAVTRLENAYKGLQELKAQLEAGGHVDMVRKVEAMLADIASVGSQN
jgi:hypothetical protein